MLSFIARIRHDPLRCALLAIVFPFEFVGYIVQAAMPVTLGGHPDKSRLLAADFYSMPAALFWAAWDGAFTR